jgi:hypothetical protein
MKTSEQIKNLAEALCKAQSEMGGAVKDSANPFFKSKYADLTSVIKAIKQPFADNGLSYTQFPVSSEHGVGVITRLMHSSGEWLEHEYILPLVKKDPQAAGSAITYARRYALQAMAGIPTADDDAESAMLRGDKPEPLSEDTVIEVAALIEKTGTDKAKVLQAYKVQRIEDLTADNAKHLISVLEKRL